MNILITIKRTMLALCAVSLIVTSHAEERFITIASTTSTENSGLFNLINPAFTQLSGINVKVVAVGTGKAIEIAKNGDADVLFVHHKTSEEQFVADGFGIERFPVMYNDFIIVGPKDDPAHIRTEKLAADALATIAANGQYRFLSRGDNSGTNKKELELWDLAGGIADKGQWYLETGQGMGKTLGMAVQMQAYTLTDRATWLNFADVGNLDILFEGDPPLFNQYGIIRVNEKKFPNIKTDLAQQYIDFVVSDEGQNLINSYQINGQQAFFANYKQSLKVAM